MTRAEYAAARRAYRRACRAHRQALVRAQLDVFHAPHLRWEIAAHDGMWAPEVLARYPPSIAATFLPPHRGTYLLDCSIATRPETRAALERACWRRSARVRRQALEAVVAACERERRVA